VTLVGGIAVSAWDVPAVLSAIAACIGLFLYLRLTRSGQCMIAVADNPQLAELYGIERNTIYVHTMAIAGLLVGLGMFLFGTRAQVQPSTSIELMLFAVVASIAGGIGNLWGAALTAVVLGVIQNGSVLFLPSEWQGLLLYVFLFAAIIFFPSGIKLPARKLKVSRRATSTLDSGPQES
jgi:branched-subunit amino acid ABC-type transport system permease component